MFASIPSSFCMPLSLLLLSWYSSSSLTNAERSPIAFVVHGHGHGSCRGSTMKDIKYNNFCIDTNIPISNGFVAGKKNDITTLSSSSSSSPLSTRMASSSAAASSSNTILFMSDWSDFQAMDDEDEEEENELFDLKMVDKREYAKEEDTQEEKAQVGASLDPPTIENYAEPIFVPTGSQLELDEGTVLGVLSACREEIGTLFGYTAENRGVGITGGVDFVEMDGPVVVLRLKGRFWHQRTTVLDRVSNYLQTRIPEIIEVTVEDEWQLTDEANEVF